MSCKHKNKSYEVFISEYGKKTVGTCDDCGEKIFIKIFFNKTKIEREVIAWKK